jgi:hypothetical protein
MAWIDVAPGVDDADNGLPGIIKLRATHRGGSRPVAKRTEIVWTVPAKAPQRLGISGKHGISSEEDRPGEFVRSTPNLAKQISVF